jgi:hypothetical protein
LAPTWLTFYFLRIGISILGHWKLFELLAKLLKNKEVVIPGKRSATRNPGFSSSSGFRLSPE